MDESLTTRKIIDMTITLSAFRFIASLLFFYIVFFSPLRFLIIHGVPFTHENKAHIVS